MAAKPYILPDSGAAIPHFIAAVEKNVSSSAFFVDT